MKKEKKSWKILLMKGTITESKTYQIYVKTDSADRKKIRDIKDMANKNRLRIRKKKD